MADSHHETDDGKDHEEDPEDKGIDVQVGSQATADSGNLAVGRVPVEFLDCSSLGLA